MRLGNLTKPRNLVCFSLRPNADPFKFTLPAGERLWLDQVEMPPGLEIAPLPHYKKCPAVTVQSTRVSILAARALAEAAEGGGGGGKKKK